MEELYNPELDRTDKYEEVYLWENVLVRDEEIPLLNHYWRDKDGELWGDFKNPMENVKRSFNAYRKLKKDLTPSMIKSRRMELNISVEDISRALNISPHLFRALENNKYVQSEDEDLHLREILKII